VKQDLAKSLDKTKMMSPASSTFSWNCRKRAQFFVDRVDADECWLTSDKQHHITDSNTSTINTKVYVKPYQHREDFKWFSEDSTWDGLRLKNGMSHAPQVTQPLVPLLRMAYGLISSLSLQAPSLT